MAEPNVRVDYGHDRLDGLFQKVSRLYSDAEAMETIDAMKTQYPGKQHLFRGELKSVLQLLRTFGAIDDDGEVKLLEIMAEKSSKQDEVLELIHQYKATHTSSKTDFVGRDEYMTQIVSKLESRVPGINLFGESGVGKTTLAKNVSEQLKNRKFESILIVSLKGINEMKTVYFRVLSKLNLPAWDYDKERIYKNLDELTTKTILILDNVENGILTYETSEFTRFLAALINTKSCKNGTLKLILTSNSEINEPSLRQNLFSEHLIEPFIGKVSKDFISRRRSVVDAEDDSTLLEISELCRNIPFMLQGAEQMMREGYRTPKQVLKKINTELKNGVPQEFACISALFHTLPNDQLKSIAVKISLLRCPFSELTAIKIAEIPTDDAKVYLEMLVTHKVITAASDGKETIYDIHALFQDFVEKYICVNVPFYKEEYEKSKKNFSRHFSEKLTKIAHIFETDFVQAYDELDKDKENFELTLNIATQNESFELIFQSNDLGKSYQEIVLFEAFKSIKARRELYKCWADKSESTGNWLNSSIMRCWESIQVADMEGAQSSLQLLQQAERSLLYETMSTYTSTDSERTKNVHAAWGLYLFCSGQINYMAGENLIGTPSKQTQKKAEEYLDKALHNSTESLEIHREVYGEHTMTSRTLNLIGNCYMALRKPKEAQRYYMDALDMKLKLVGSEEHLEIPTYYSQLAEVHEQLGCERNPWPWLTILFYVIAPGQSAERQHLMQAAKLLHKAIDLQKKLKMTESDNYATFQRNYANVLTGLGEYEKALKHAQESYEIRNRRLGQHPETVRIIYLMGIIHECRKDCNAALESYEMAFEMEESLPMDNHSVVRMRIRDRLLEMCKKLGKKDKLKEYEQRIKKIGEEQIIDLAEVTTSQSLAIDSNGGFFSLPKSGFFLDVPKNAVTQQTKVNYFNPSIEYLPSPAWDFETLVSYIVGLGLGPRSVQLRKPIKVTLMHSGPGKEHGFELVVKAFNEKEAVWDCVEEIENQMGAFKDCKTVSVKITRLTSLAVVARLVTDRFRVTPRGCVVTSSVCKDVTLTFPKGAVDRTHQGSMKVVLMPNTICQETKTYPCPILYVNGFEGVQFLEFVTIRMPHPCPAIYPAGQIRVMCLKHHKWEDITDQGDLVIEHKSSIEIHTRHFSVLWPWLSAVRSSFLLLYQYLSKPPQAVCFAAFKDN